MLRALRSLFQSTLKEDNHSLSIKINSDAPIYIYSAGHQQFPFKNTLHFIEDLPTPDWSGISNWMEGLESDEARATAWAEIELAWLQSLRASLGSTYHLTKQSDVLILSTLDERTLDATFDFVTRTAKRIVRVLDGIADVPEWGYDILIIFDDQDTYYRYVSRYYEEDGEFSLSGGIYINNGCGHFVAVKSELQSLEPVIVHEMTHSYLGHLPIPAWLNEGIAINTEYRLSATPIAQYTPQEMHEMHLTFWGDSEIQEFWSGQSFLRSDEGNMLSYDLARILVEHFSADWPSFQQFANTADISDSGAKAAEIHLGVKLGAAVLSIFGEDNDGTWEPNSSLWKTPPERGAFYQNLPIGQVLIKGGL